MPPFWKVRNILFWEQKDFTKLTPKLEVSSTFLLKPELIWGSPYARGLRYHLPYRTPFRLTTYSIDKYRNVEGPKCASFERLGISHFEKEEFCKTHPKNWESFFHIPSPTWADLRFPYARGPRYHLPYRTPFQIDNYYSTQMYITV